MLAKPGADWGLHIGYFSPGLTSLGLIVLYFTIPEASKSNPLDRAQLMEPQTRGRRYCRAGRAVHQANLGRRFKETMTWLDLAKETQQGRVTSGLDMKDGGGDRPLMRVTRSVHVLICMAVRPQVQEY